MSVGERDLVGRGMQRIRPELVSLLRQLEECLLLSDGGAEEALLDEEFRGVSTTGRMCGPQELSLCMHGGDTLWGGAQARVTMAGFEVAILTMDHQANEVAMTSYVTAHGPAAQVAIPAVVAAGSEAGLSAVADAAVRAEVPAAGRHVRHTSVWMNTGDRWRMRFHQATMLETEWSAAAASRVERAGVVARS